MTDDLERVPPHDLASEQAVLGAMMTTEKAITDAEQLLGDGQAFYRPAHTTIYRTILELRDAGSPTDPIAVTAHLAGSAGIGKVGGAEYLHTCYAAVPLVSSVTHYATTVANYATLRNLARYADRVRQLAATSSYTDAGGALEQARQLLADLDGVKTRRDTLRLWSEITPGLLEEIERAEQIEDGPAGISSGLHDLDDLLGGFRPGELILVGARPGVGKALAIDTPLPTPTGWTTMGDVQVGDHLIGADGRPTAVVAATEIMHGRPCYEVEFSDGTVVVADAQHQWLTETRASRRSAQAAAAQYNRYRNQRTFAAVRTTEELAATLHCETADRRINHSVVNTKPLSLPDADLPLTPYALGVWLGDGSSWHASFTTADTEIVTNLESEGYRVVRHAAKYQFGLRLPEATPDVRICVVCGAKFMPKRPGSTVRTCGWSCGGRATVVSSPVAPPRCPCCGAESSGSRHCRSCERTRGSVKAILNTLGVVRNKHIPEMYLRASEQQRRDLLAGLLDTDGTVTTGGSVQFTTTSTRLARDCYDLVAGLGYRVTISTKRVKGRRESTSVCYMVNFTAADKVFRLTRKAARQSAAIRAGTLSRYIVAVRPVASVPVRCVQVASADHMYLASRSYIPTHNSVLLLNFAAQAAMRQKLRTAFFSLEMSELEIGLRIASAGTSIPLKLLRAGRLDDQQWSKLTRFVADTDEAPLHIDQTPRATLAHIRAGVKRVIAEHGGVDLILVDYLQLTEGSGGRESRQEQVAALSRGLKLLGKEVGAPVVAASQLNRGPEQRSDKRPALSDLRESGALEQDADVVLLLHREDANDHESPRAGECDIVVGKNRHGPQDTVTVASQLHLCRFQSMAVL